MPSTAGIETRREPTAMKNVRQLLIAVAFSLPSAYASAVQVFDFTLSGEAFVSLAPFPLPPVYEFLPVTGTARVTLADGDDGVYTGAAFQGFSAFLEVGNRFEPGFSRSESFGGDGSSFGFNGPSRVELAGGHVTNIYLFPNAYWTVNQLVLTVPLIGRDYSTSLRLVEVTPVPEPETWALMLAGLAGVGYAARRPKRGSAASAAAK